jgi:AcrR family transcriptional regulator
MTTDASIDETRQRIIDAALKLFGEVGYTRATTRAIAEAAGVNEVTIFRHFGNKKNLLFACVSAFNQVGFAETFQAHLTGDYAADIRKMAQLQMADTAGRFEVIRLLLCEAQAVPELREAVLMGAAGNRGHLLDYFRQQLDAGVIRPDLSPALLVVAFDSLFSSYVLFENLLGTPLTGAPATEAVIHSLASIFIRGTAAAGAV